MKSAEMTFVAVRMDVCQNITISRGFLSSSFTFASPVRCIACMGHGTHGQAKSRCNAANASGVSKLRRKKTNRKSYMFGGNYEFSGLQCGCDSPISPCLREVV